MGLKMGYPMLVIISFPSFHGSQASMAMVGRCRLQLRQQLLLRIWGAWWSQAAEARLQRLEALQAGITPISGEHHDFWGGNILGKGSMNIGKTSQSRAFGRSK